MKVRPGARVYAHYGFRNLPTAPPLPEDYLVGAWRALSWWNDPEDPVWQKVAEQLDVPADEVAAGTAGIARGLVASPTATGNPAGTVVLTAGRHMPLVRLADVPEVVILDAGVIEVS